MNIKEAYYLCTIVEEGSLNKASKAMYVAQPSLSKCIKKIENEYDITIFSHKRGSKIMLTEEGKLLYKLASKIVDAEKDFKSQLNILHMVSEQMICFGAPVNRTFYLAGEMLQWFYSNYPEYQLELRSDLSDNLLKKLKDHLIDVIYICTDQIDPDLYYEKIKGSHITIYLSKGSDLKKYATDIGLELPVISLKHFEGETIAVNSEGSASRNGIDQLLNKNDILVHLKELSNLYARFEYANAGKGHCLYIGEEENWMHLEKDRLLYLDPSEDLGFKQYLICRKGFETDTKYKLIRECMDYIKNL